jgi:SAM-dependent methyltransferase
LGMMGIAADGRSCRGRLVIEGVMPEINLAPWVTLTQIVFGVSALAMIWAYLPVAWGAPWVPTSSKTAQKMLAMAALQPGQTLVDLGAGDGRIVIAAARDFGAQAEGVEIDPLRSALANGLIRLAGLRGKARVICGNMYAYDCRDADVVTVYLLQGTNQRLKDHLVRQLRPGARVVSHTFSMNGWVPVAIDEKQGIFLYEIGRTGEDVQTEFV